MSSFNFDINKDYGFTDRVNSLEELREWDLFRFNKIKQISEECTEVLDFGAASRCLSEILPFRNYKSIDFCAAFKPDIVADICDMYMIKDEEYSGVICSAVLEHVYNPFKAVEELYRIMKKDGYLYVYVPFLFKYHAPKSGEFKDYWRFTKDGIHHLFMEHVKFSSMEYAPIRYEKETIMNLTKLFGKRSLFHKIIGRKLYKNAQYTDEMVSGFSILCRK